MRRAHAPDPAPRARVPDIIAAIKDGYARLSRAEQPWLTPCWPMCRPPSTRRTVNSPSVPASRNPPSPRFCRSIGCDGVRDFKLNSPAHSSWANSTLPPRTPPRADTATLPPWWLSVFGEARAALDALRIPAVTPALQDAADHLARARRVAAFGLGGSSSALAEETQYRLFRYGIGITALKDPWVARMQPPPCGRATS